MLFKYSLLIQQDNLLKGLKLKHRQRVSSHSFAAVFRIALHIGIYTIYLCTKFHTTGGSFSMAAIPTNKKFYHGRHVRIVRFTQKPPYQ